MLEHDTEKIELKKEKINKIYPSEPFKSEISFKLAIY